MGSENQMIRTYCDITIKLMDKSSKQLFIINTNRFFQIFSKRLETELYNQAKLLAAELDKYLKLKHEWKGYKEE